MTTNAIQEFISSIRGRGMTPSDAAKLVELQTQLQSQNTSAGTEPDTAPEPAPEVPETDDQDSVQDTSPEGVDEKPTTDNKNELETITKRWKDSQRYIQELKDQLKKKDSELNKFQKYASDEDVAKFENDIGEYSPAIKELIRRGIVEGINAFKEDFTVEQEVRQKEASAITEQHLTAKQLVAAAHPDWEDIGNNAGFKKWMGTQSDKVRNLAENSSDPYDVIMVIDLFKAQTGWDKKNKTEEKRAKTAVVNARDTVPNPKGPEFLDVPKLRRELQEALRSGEKRHLVPELTAKLNKALSIKR